MGDRPVNGGFGTRCDWLVFRGGQPDDDDESVAAHLLTVVGAVALVGRVLVLLERVAVAVLGEAAAEAGAGDSAVLALLGELAGLALLLVVVVVRLV